MTAHDCLEFANHLKQYFVFDVLQGYFWFKKYYLNLSVIDIFFFTLNDKCNSS